MTEFDFAGWVVRARAFTLGLGHLPATEVRSTSVAAPLDEADLRSLEGALGASLPASLRAFFNRGTSAMDCAYIFKPEGQALAQLRTLRPDESEIFGGAKMGPASGLADYCKAVREWARDTWIADEPDQRIIWESALEELHGSLVLLGSGSRRKSAEVSPATGSSIDLPRVQAVLTSIQLANHVSSSSLGVARYVVILRDATCVITQVERRTCPAAGLPVE